MICSSFEWTSIGLPHGIEVVGRPHIKSWASSFKVQAVADFFYAIVLGLFDFNCTSGRGVVGNFSLGLEEVSYSGTEAYAKAFAVVLFVEIVLQVYWNF